MNPSSSLSRPILPAAVLFDMDGTLTEPMLDFRQIKAEMGIGAEPILEALSRMDPVRRQQAEAILHRYEEHAAAGSTLNPGCGALLAWLHERRIPAALITRNSRRSVETVMRRHELTFEVLITREDGRFKPDPHPLFLACQRLGVEAPLAWMVGDGQYDVEAGIAAGMRTVWLSHGQDRRFNAEPWRSVRDLPEFLDLLQSCQLLPAG